MEFEKASALATGMCSNGAVMHANFNENAAKASRFLAMRVRAPANHPPPK
jgi:hypothetical protein